MVGAGEKPLIGDLIEDFGEDVGGNGGAGVVGGCFEGGGPGEQDVVADVGEGRVGEARSVGPVVVEVEGGAMVDEVGFAMPVEKVGVAGGAVDVEDEGVEPDGEGGGAGIGLVAGSGVEHGGAGEVVEGKVEADAGAEEIADLLVRLVAPQGGIDFGEDEFRDVEAEGTADLTGYEFGYKGERALAGAAEFYDVEAEVVGLDDGGEGATLAESGYVLRGTNGTKHCCLV